MKWYEINHKRFVLEYIKIKNKYPDFLLHKINDDLVWDGEVKFFNNMPLKIRIVLEDSYPVVAPKIFPIDSNIPKEQWGHEWHKWEEGNICYVNPKDWSQKYYLVEIIDKVKVWNFNFFCYKNELVPQMPDVGLAFNADEGDI